MDKFVIISDTRQQEGKHEAKLAYFKAQGYKVVRTKLFVGDYARLDNQTIAIDTKKDFLELCGNVCGNQHERFRDECKRAKECGIQLIVLREEIPPHGNLAEWHSPRTKVKGETLAKCLRTMQERYGVKFGFCDKASTGKIIINILKGVDK